MLLVMRCLCVVLFAWLSSSCLMIGFQSSIIPTTNTSGVLTKSGVRVRVEGVIIFIFYLIQ